MQTTVRRNVARHSATRHKHPKRLHGLVVEQRLRHPGVAEVDRHVANAVTKPTPRGCRLVKSAEGAQTDDSLISFAMDAERATQPVADVKFRREHDGR